MAQRKEQIKVVKQIFTRHQDRVRALPCDDPVRLAAWRIVADLRKEVLSAVGSTIWTDFAEKNPPVL